MTHREEFPDFPARDMPALPASFDDVSWQNDTCPSFLNEEAGLIIFVDYLEPSRREFPDAPRFSVGVWDNGHTGESLAASDDWAVILAAIQTFQHH